MLGEQIEEKLKELRELCLFEANDETVHISFNLNSQGWSTEITERNHQSLLNDGISMRNIKGEWIK